MRRQGCQTVSNTGLCLDPSKISSSEGMASKPASLSLLSTQSSGFGIPLGIPIPSTYMYFFNDGNAIWNRLCTMSWMREPEEPDDGPPKHVSLCPSHIRPGVSDKRLACGVGPRYGSMERLRQPRQTDISVPSVERQRFGPSPRSPRQDMWRWKGIQAVSVTNFRLRTRYCVAIATLAPRNRDHAFKRNLILRRIPSVPGMRVPEREACSRADLAQ